MGFRLAVLVAGVIVAAGLAAPAARAQAPVVERIQLQYIDARIVAAALGGMVLPTEDQLFFARLQGGLGSGFSPNLGGFMGGAQPSPFAGGLASGYGLGLGGGGFGSGRSLPSAAPAILLADPATNSVLLR